MIDCLLNKIEENKLNVDVKIIKKAYDYAYEAHKEQKRESGEPYIIHPVEVATILVELGMDTSTIAAGLLHDVVEDTPSTYDDMCREFNTEIANLIDGVTKLGKIKYKTKEEQQADNVRKMLLAMAKDIRVIIIKLADRLHNLRTLKYMPKEKQKMKAQETLDIYAPLAHRLGMSKIKWELEDLSFRYLHEKEYYDLVKAISEKRVEREEYIADIIKDLKDKLEDSGIDSDIDGRPKHFYSIYRKMVNKNKTIEQIFDLTAIRILVNSVKDCYGVLGIVHTIYKPIPGRFKDYIAMPKPNMYQSLHTTVIGPQGKTFEIQIRTFDMHKTAEYGIAAHWKYKEGDSNDDSDGEKDFEKKLVWLRDILEWQKETSDAEEFMEGFKIDLFSDEVFVFTPKGVVINLPGGSTPLDFAYRIHTDVGNKCVGAKVSGKIVSLDYQLKTGQIVEILTSKNSKGPSMSWLNMVKTNHAKSKIRAWFKKVAKEENILKGKEIFEKELKKQGVHYNDIAKGETYERMLKRYNIHSIEDLYSIIGDGQASASHFISRLKEENMPHKVTEEELKKNIDDSINKNIKKKKKDNYCGISVKGESNVMVRFARCCNPVPGDDVLGYITKGRGVSVHRTDCANLQALIASDADKVIEVSWGTEKGVSYITEIRVRAEDHMGILQDIMTIMADLNLNLSGLNANSIKGNEAVFDIKVSISSVEQLDVLMKKLRAIKSVIDVFRINS